MSAKHTPGPLKASKGWDGEPERWVVLSESEPHFHIATIGNGQPGDTCETEGHTARLFAAAPELLAALEDLRDAKWLNLPGLAGVIIEAAIAKAKGEAS